MIFIYNAMHYFLYPTKDAFISNDPAYTLKNTGIDEILELEKRISATSCASSTTYSSLVGYTSSSLELLSGSMSASFDSGSTDPHVVSSSYITATGDTSLGSVLSRALLQFNLQGISSSISSGEITNPKFYLNLKTCNAVEIPIAYTLVAYPLAVTWSMGTGYKYDGQAYANGVNWKYLDAAQTSRWYSGSLKDCSGGGKWWVSASLIGYGSGYAEPPFVDPYNPYPECPTSSYVAPTASVIQPVTGGFACYQTFDYETSDVKMDVTTIVNAWLSRTIVNNGIILMHSDESSSVDYGSLKFFSKESNTIYSPYIDVAWDDSTFVTGSDEVRLNDTVVSIKNMTKEYKSGAVLRLDVSARKRYPTKTFTNRLSDYLVPYALPYNSFYSVKDAESEDLVLPYDNYTRLSFDANGNFFMLDTTGLPQERYFKIEIRSEQSGSIMTFSVPTTFKISR